MPHLDGEVVAPELPCEDRAAGFAEYAAACPDGDVIVGHSLGGITAGLVARRCGGRVVYLAALLPGSPLGEMVCDGLEFERRDGLDHFVNAEAVGLDPAQLRGQAPRPYFELDGEAVPGLYIGCARDRVVRPGFQRAHADVMLDCGHLPQVDMPERVAGLLP